MTCRRSRANGVPTCRQLVEGVAAFRVGRLALGALGTGERYLNAAQARITGWAGVPILIQVDGTADNALLVRGKRHGGRESAREGKQSDDEEREASHDVLVRQQADEC